MSQKDKDKVNYYIDKEEFSKEVHAYAELARQADKDGVERPQIPYSIAKKLMSICEGTSMGSGFKGYSFRESMVSLAIDSCLRYIANYDINAQTRSGKPNAFGYFTRIAMWAFVRKIKIEEKQRKLKQKLVRSTSFGASVHLDEHSRGTQAEYVTRSYLESVQILLDEEFGAYDSDEKPNKKTVFDDVAKMTPRTVVDSALEELFE